MKSFTVVFPFHGLFRWCNSSSQNQLQQFSGTTDAVFQYHVLKPYLANRPFVDLLKSSNYSQPHPKLPPDSKHLMRQIIYSSPSLVLFSIIKAHLHGLLCPTKVTSFSWSWQCRPAWAVASLETSLNFCFQHLSLFEASGHVPSLAPLRYVWCHVLVPWPGSNWNQKLFQKAGPMVFWGSSESWSVEWSFPHCCSFRPRLL